MNVVLLSGSLRKKSYNTALLRSTIELAPNRFNFQLFTELADLPYFDPDISEENIPETVINLQSQLLQADGVIISTPEYAYSMPGVLKNTLDWLVASSALVLKPVVVFSASTSELGGTRAHSGLVVTLSAMNARVIVDASLNVPFAQNKIDDHGQLIHSLTQQAIANSLSMLEHVINIDK